MTEDLPYFIVKFKIKCLPASWLSIAFSGTDLMLQFCLPYRYGPSLVCECQATWHIIIKLKYDDATEDIAYHLHSLTVSSTEPVTMLSVPLF